MKCFPAPPNIGAQQKSWRTHCSGVASKYLLNELQCKCKTPKHACWNRWSSTERTQATHPAQAGAKWNVLKMSSGLFFVTFFPSQQMWNGNCMLIHGCRLFCSRILKCVNKISHPATCTLNYEVTQKQAHGKRFEKPNVERIVYCCQAAECILLFLALPSGLHATALPHDHFKSTFNNYLRHLGRKPVSASTYYLQVKAGIDWQCRKKFSTSPNLNIHDGFCAIWLTPARAWQLTSLHNTANSKKVSTSQAHLGRTSNCDLLHLCNNEYWWMSGRRHAHTHGD